MDPTEDCLTPPARHPDAAYQSALTKYEPVILRTMAQALSLPIAGARVPAIVSAFFENWAAPRAVARAWEVLDEDARGALGLIALVEVHCWPLDGLRLTLSAAGFAPEPALTVLIESGLLVLQVDPSPGPNALTVPTQPALLLPKPETPGVQVVAHPAVFSAARTVLPPSNPLPAIDSVRQVREADGVEAILRLAALWQRVGTDPLRRTQTGTLYKRDRDRLEDDPALAGPIADHLEPLPDPVPFWIGLARGLGLLIDEAGSDRIVAATAEYWSEHAVHLPRMIAVAWMGLRTWHEQLGAQDESRTIPLVAPFLRPAVLLLLAQAEPGHFLAIDDIAERLDRVVPNWDRLTLTTPDVADVPRPAPRGKGPMSRGKGEELTGPAARLALLKAVLLGPAYQLGLIRVGEEVPSGRSMIGLSALGRYVLSLGPPSSSREEFDKFLFVQPNFEIIAYRQGLTPARIGQLSRFLRLTRIGAAAELRLASESVYAGLEGGMTSREMFDRLTQYCTHPLSAGVQEAIKNWSGRRERVTFLASATLMEFASSEALEAALEAWPTDGRRLPARVASRFLLVEGEEGIPFELFRLAGSRDYRRPPEVCVDIEPDGVHLALDLSRSDLLVEAEILRFADEVASGTVASKRRFRISSASLSRALNDGMSTVALGRWFEQRAGQDVPPAIRLLIHAINAEAAPLRVGQPLVLRTPTAEVLDGLLQHPKTKDYLGERLGPTAVLVASALLDRLRKALGELGIVLAEIEV